MRKSLISWLPALALLAGCSSLGYERQALTELTQRYGGEATLQPGYNFTTRAGASRGSYLAIHLASPGLGRRYNDLAIPASSCALLTYQGIAASEPDRYATYTVSLTDPDSAVTRRYTYPATALAQAKRAADDLVTLVADWQQHEFLAAAGTFEPAALGTARPDSLLPLMMRTARALAPLSRYDIEGFKLVEASVGGQRLRLVQVLASVPRPMARGFFLVTINPARPAGGRFLYGLQLLRQLPPGARQ